MVTLKFWIRCRVLFLPAISLKLRKVRSVLDSPPESTQSVQCVLELLFFSSSYVCLQNIKYKMLFNSIAMEGNIEQFSSASEVDA